LGAAGSISGRLLLAGSLDLALQSSEHREVGVAVLLNGISHVVPRLLNLLKGDGRL
jgi:hypothetical protein